MIPSKTTQERVELEGDIAFWRSLTAQDFDGAASEYLGLIGEYVLQYKKLPPDDGDFVAQILLKISSNKKQARAFIKEGIRRKPKSVETSNRNYRLAKRVAELQGTGLPLVPSKGKEGLFEQVAEEFNETLRQMKLAGRNTGTAAISGATVQKAWNEFAEFVLELNKDMGVG